MREFALIVLGVVLVNNYVLSRFLGLCPYMGVSKKTSSALGMGCAVVFVMTMASVATWCIYRYVLLPYDLVYLRTLAFILVNREAKKNSFHAHTRQNTAVIAAPGLINGNIIFQKIPNPL